MADVKEAIKATVDNWFLSEPLLFAAYCGHQLVENRKMRCSMRSGRRMIEYNPEILSGLGDTHIAELLRREIVRIILKHPYERQPVNPIPELLYLASNVTIYQHNGSHIPPCLPAALVLPERKSFEEYYNIIQHESQDARSGNSENDKPSCGRMSDSIDMNGGGDAEQDSHESMGDGMQSDGCDDCYSGEGYNARNQKTVSEPSGSNINDVVKKDNGTDATELWEEDDIQIEYINRCIEDAMLSKRWGSLAGNIRDLIKASTLRCDNIRRKMDMFRTSIISTRRRLTRMRPSRRYGWVQMGVQHPYTSRLLIAVDTSGSVDKKDLIRFFRVINSFFTYGIPFIDVLQFDYKVHPPLLSLKKAADRIALRGRGGTNFQAPVDYFVEHKEYDGMIVFTDGYAPNPQMPPHRKILWVLQDIECYSNFSLSPKVYI